MTKKIILILVVLAALAFTALNILFQRAPVLLRSAIEKTLDKTVLIRSIDYHFPDSFQLQGFAIKEKRFFPGEISFYADDIRLDVSLLSLSQKSLLIKRVEVENAAVTIRHYQGKMIHALSDALQQS